MNTQIIILAAGKGNRMNLEIPKALVPFHGKPMIDYPLGAVEHSGVSLEPILVVGYKKELVIEHVKDKVIYVTQEEQLGTGHAVKVTKDSIPKEAENVLVLFCDQPAVTGAMIANMIKVHEENNCALTMATVTVPSYDDWYQVFYAPFSRIIRGADGKIARSVEFKDATEEERKIKEINPVYLCFKKDWLFNHLELLNNKNIQKEYYLPDLVQYAAKDGGIASFAISPEEALGVNSVEELKQLEKIIKK